MARHCLAVVLLLLCAVPALAGETRTITDALGRQVTIPAKVERVICSGPGCLRLLVYLQAQDLAVAVDDIEGKRSQFDARPYALAQPRLRTLPVFGEFRGFDNPERILALPVQPQVIFKVIGMGHDPVELERKTGIPVVALNYGDLGGKRQQFYAALRLMGQVLGRGQRAEEITAFFDAAIADLARRTDGLAQAGSARVYLGGVAYKGPHGFESTEPGYPPFLFLKARNLAAEAGGIAPEQSTVAKEKIVEWNPDVLFLDLSTMQLGEEGGGLHELKTDPAYQTLDAVRQGRVYGLLPYNWYNQNFGSILADAYYVGTVLYPERFRDVDPAAKADAIYAFLVGRPVFGEMNKLFKGLAFRPVPLR